MFVLGNYFSLAVENASHSFIRLLFWQMEAMRILLGVSEHVVGGPLILFLWGFCSASGTCEWGRYLDWIRWTLEGVRSVHWESYLDVIQLHESLFNFWNLVLGFAGSVLQYAGSDLNLGFEKRSYICWKAGMEPGELLESNWLFDKDCLSLLPHRQLYGQKQRGSMSGMWFLVYQKGTG